MRHPMVSKVPQSWVRFRPRNMPVKMAKGLQMRQAIPSGFIRKPKDIKLVYTFVVNNVRPLSGLARFPATLVHCPACLIHHCPIISGLSRGRSLKRWLCVGRRWLFHPTQRFLISQTRGVVAERLNDPFADGFPESRVLPHPMQRSTTSQ